MINSLIDICQILKNGIIIQRKSIGHAMMEVTKTNKKIGLILVSVLALSAISGGIILTTYAFDDEGCRPFKQPFFGDLTDAQKEEITTTMNELRENGASREEIREAITAKLTEWGIEVPEDNPHPMPRWLQNLTEEQKAELQNLMDELKEKGASHEEIRAEIDAKLQQWGIEIPEQPMPPPQ